MTTFWVITHGTTDYGDRYVVRKHHVKAGDTIVELAPTAVTDSLDEARRHIPAHLFRLPPTEGDDPVIVESWV